MIIADSTQRAMRIFDYVQTLLGIENEDDLKIISVEPEDFGFRIYYKVYEASDDESSATIDCNYFFDLYNSQILLLNSFL